MAKAIVFGGCGFIGRKTVEHLVRNGFETVVFDIKSPENKNSSVKYIEGDYLDLKKVLTALENADFVYNFAGIVDMDLANQSAYNAIHTNVLGNLNILEACAINKVKRYVFASSVYVYSEKGSFYRCSKQMCEIMIEEYQKKFNLDYTILRYGSVYGPNAQENNWIKDILTQALIYKKIVRYSDGEELREYIHVEDAAKASVEILNDEFKNENVILTGNTAIKIKDLLTMIKEIFNNEIEIEFKPECSFEDHYEMTPYSFRPKLGKKYIVNPHIDLGQGILDILHKMKFKN